MPLKKRGACATQKKPGDKHHFFPKASRRPEGFLPKAEKFFDKDDGVMLVVILRENKVLLMMVVTNSTAQGGGGSFKDRKLQEVSCCCDAWMAERIH